MGPLRDAAQALAGARAIKAAAGVFAAAPSRASSVYFAVNASMTCVPASDAARDSVFTYRGVHGDDCTAFATLSEDLLAALLAAERSAQTAGVASAHRSSTIDVTTAMLVLCAAGPLCYAALVVSLCRRGDRHALWPRSKLTLAPLFFSVVALLATLGLGLGLIVTQAELRGLQRPLASYTEARTRVARSYLWPMVLAGAWSSRASAAAAAPPPLSTRSTSLPFLTPLQRRMSGASLPVTTSTARTPVAA